MLSQTTPYVEGGQTAHENGHSHCPVCDHPFSSALAIFGLGLGAGVLVGTMLLGPSRQRDEKAIRRSAENLLDALANIIPESVSKRMS